jgi:hypothetical protein
MARPPGPRRHPHRAASPAGCLHRLLQHLPAAPGHRAPHPRSRLERRPRAIPARQGIRISEHFRVRRDRVDADGKLTLRHNSRLHHIGIGRRWSGTKVLILARDLDIRIITQNDGELIRQLSLDPSRNYQPQAPRV